MKSKSAFIRKLILYGYVYDVDYSFLWEYNTELGRISSSLNQIAKRINSPNKAYHLIQAFAPSEVSFDEAHQIGKELANKVLEGKFSYVVTTHIDIREIFTNCF